MGSEMCIRDRCKELLGYSVMWITSKHGAIIDGVKVRRDKFFDTMNKWGDDPNKKFIMFHHSILLNSFFIILPIA